MKITLCKIYNYISEDDGRIIPDKHPAILLEDKNLFTTFVFTHDEKYGIEEMLKNYSCKLMPAFSNTVVTKENLNATKEYYENIYNDKSEDYSKRKEAKFILNHLCEGFKCLHPIENNISYLSQEIPFFTNRKDFKFYPLVTSENKAVTVEDYNNIDRYKEMYAKFLPLIEKALINDRLYKYDASSKETDNFLEIQKEKFSQNERLDLAYEIHNRISIINHTEKISKSAFLEKILTNVEQGKIKNFEIESLKDYIQEIKENEIEAKIKIKEFEIKEITNKLIYFKEKNDKYNIEKYTEKLQDENDKYGILLNERNEIFSKYDDFSDDVE